MKHFIEGENLDKARCCLSFWTTTWPRTTRCVWSTSLSKSLIWLASGSSACDLRKRGDLLPSN